MKRFLLIAKEDKASPFAVENVLRITTKENNVVTDVVDVVYINVSHAGKIGQGLLFEKQRIISGKVKVTAEARELVSTLSMMANDKGHRKAVDGKLVRDVAKHLGKRNKIKCEHCMLLA